MAVLLIRTRPAAATRQCRLLAMVFNPCTRHVQILYTDYSLALVQVGSSHFEVDVKRDSGGAVAVCFSDLKPGNPVHPSALIRLRVAWILYIPLPSV